MREGGEGNNLRDFLHGLIFWKKQRERANAAEGRGSIPTPGTDKWLDEQQEKAGSPPKDQRT